jgi:hypothetical protein
MTKAARVGFVVFVLGAGVVFATPARAACHAFEVEATPSTVSEGGRVTVTVSRDAAENPSSVRVSTVNESARSPGDYASLNREVQFTSDTRQSFTIAIGNDATPEGPETFKLHLSEPDGCAANTNYELGPDQRVIIRANDPTPVPPPPPAPTQTTITTAPPSSPTPSPTPSPSPSPTVSPSPTFSPTSPLQLAEEDDTGSGGITALAIVGLILGASIAGIGGYLLWLRSRAA